VVDTHSIIAQASRIASAEIGSSNFLTLLVNPGLKKPLSPRLLSKECEVE
jgi:hypothetical protein